MTVTPAGAVFQKAPPKERLEELRARAESLRSQVDTLEAQERAVGDQVQAQAQQAALRKAKSEELARRHRKMGVLCYAALGVGVAAGVGAIAVSPFLGILAAGGFVGAMLAAKERMRCDEGAHVLGFSAGNQKLLSMLNGAQAGLLHNQRTALEQQLQEVERQRQAVEVECLARGPEAAGTIEAAEETVSVAGVVLPRRR